jgi:acetoin utilization protein AcuB
MWVREHMSTPAVTVRPEMDYQAVLKLMQDNALHHLPVVDDRGALVGIAAERDLLMAATRFLQAPVEVNEIMHRGVVTATPDMPIAKAADLMIHHRIGGLPVVDGGGKVLGIITESDVFRALVAGPGQHYSA